MIWLSRRPIQLVRLAWLLMLVTFLASIGIPASAFLCEPYSEEEEYILSPGLPVCPGTTIYVMHIVSYYKVVGYNPCTYELYYEEVTYYPRLPKPGETEDCSGGDGEGDGEGPPPPPCTDPTTCCDGLDGPTG